MANHIEIRKVIIRSDNGSGGWSETETWQYRTRDVTASVLGLIPLSSSWSSWTNVETTTVVVDENGAPL